MADTDSFNSRDDIHQLVDNMRSTYLRAIEAREPSLHAVKSLKKRKKKRKYIPTGAPRLSSVMSGTSGPPEQQSVTATNSPIQSQRSTRIVSTPVAGINTLPAIEASPIRERDPEIGLKRADSATLGTLMGETKRASIKKRASKRHSRRSSIRRDSIQKVSPKVSPSKSTNSNRETVNTNSTDRTLLGDEFETVYKDIFRSSMHDFWQSSPLDTLDIVSPLGASTASTMAGLTESPSPTPA